MCFATYGTKSTENTIKKSIRWRVRRKRQRLTSNGSIESDAAVQPPLGSQECLAASLPIEFLEFIVPDPLHEA